MTVNEVMQTQYYLSQGPASKLPGAKFAYAAHKNVCKMRTALKEAERAFGLDLKREGEARIAREDLKQKYCTKGEDGEPVIEDGCYLGLDSDEFKAEWGALSEKYKDIQEAREKFMQSEVEFEVHKITSDSLPQGITTEMMSLLDFMVED